jgi:chorismate mutase
MLEVDINKLWLNDFYKSNPFVIAGPCSAETETQVLEIAYSLKEADLNIMRAGIWKPRTRPGSFEGVGAIGLKWLLKAKEETGLKTAIEVASPHHIKLALDHDVDILWIGARTTVNPFLVQDLADALINTDKIVLVKNPVNPDLALWIGAIERFLDAGVTKIGAVHRGFSTYEKIKYRNNPQWQIPINLQAKFSNLPLILDPSHISGNRDLIFELSQTAFDLNYDGLMIETHNDPDNAWSDAAQQITPESLQNVLSHLQIRRSKGETEGYKKELLKWRANIDILDEQIMDVIAKRMLIADEIGLVKKEHNVAILQTERWQAILQKMMKHGLENNLTEDFILSLFNAIHQESIYHQNKVING